MKLIDFTFAIHTVKPGRSTKWFGFDAGRFPDGRRFLRLGPLVLTGKPTGPPPGHTRMVFDVPSDCAPVLDALRGKTGFSVGSTVPRPCDKTEPDTVH